MNINNFFSKNNNKKVYIIAEACDNHFGSLNLAKRMIIKAKLAGADAIKFQHHLPDEEMLKKVPKSKNFSTGDLYSFLKKNALNLKQHLELKKFSQINKIQYLCTPFSLAAAKELNNRLKIDAFKIGSGEMTDIPSLKEIAKFNKPMIISTGMSMEFEIMRTYKSLKNINKKLAFLHCLSEYPVDPTDLNLGYIQILKKKFPKNIIGYSDHSINSEFAIGAVALGAQIIEKHVTLDKKMKGPDQNVSIDFEDLKILIESVRNLEKSLGKIKKIHKKEKIIRKWAFRSLVSIKDIKKGAKFTLNNTWSKRPGTGIPSFNLNKVLGKKSKIYIKKDQLIKWNQIKK
ncbi:N-acetylneuraminate synthase family protein [Candidatus Pelagibacter sp.]|jgi:sialic acid synthase SpsE|nr:N-acetylneuraminate synthase family protein [Candidatus Pelagibacter sp.]